MSTNGNYLFHLGDAFDQDFANAVVQGHVGTGATDASPMEADFHGAIFRNVNQFHITAISLNGWTDEVD